MLYMIKWSMINKKRMNIPNISVDDYRRIDGSEVNIFWSASCHRVFANVIMSNIFLINAKSNHFYDDDRHLFWWGLKLYFNRLDTIYFSFFRSRFHFCLNASYVTTMYMDYISWVSSKKSAYRVAIWIDLCFLISNYRDCHFSVVNRRLDVIYFSSKICDLTSWNIRIDNESISRDMFFVSR